MRRKWALNNAFAVILSLLLCSTPFTELWRWHRVLPSLLVDATGYVLIEREIPEMELKADAQGRKRPQFQMALVADKMVTHNVDHEFPGLTERWREQFGKTNPQEYERKRRLLVTHNSFVNTPKVQLVEGPAGKSYAVVFAGESLVHEKFTEALERAKRRPGGFHVKSSKELADRLKTAFEQANWELGDELKAHNYLATNGRNNYQIRVGEKRSGMLGKVKNQLFGAKMDIEELRGNLHTGGWQKDRMKHRMHQQMEDNGFVRPGPPGVGSQYVLGRQQLLDTIQSSFADQSRYLTDEDTPGPVSRSTHGYLMPPVIRENEDGGRGSGSSSLSSASPAPPTGRAAGAGSGIQRWMSGRMSRRPTTSAGAAAAGRPEAIGHNDPEEERKLKNRMHRSIFKIIDDLEREGDLSPDEARLKREEIRKRPPRQQQLLAVDDWDKQKRFDRGMPSRRPVRGRKGKSASADSARNSKPPPVPSGTKWARKGKNRVGKAARRMFG